MGKKPKPKQDTTQFYFNLTNAVLAIMWVKQEHSSKQDRVSTLRELQSGSILQSSKYIQIKGCLLNNYYAQDTGVYTTEWCFSDFSRQNHLEGLL